LVEEEIIYCEVEIVDILISRFDRQLFERKMADCLVYLNKFNGSVESKDKAYKVVQYGARFLVWFLSVRLEKGNQDDVVVKLGKLDVAVTDARRLFRIFRFAAEPTRILQSLQALNTSYNSSYNSSMALYGVQLGLIVLRSVGYAGYFFFNPISWFIKMGIINNNILGKYDMATITRVSLKLWMLGVISWILLDTVQFVDFISNLKRRRKLNIVSEAQFQSDSKKKTKDLVLNHVKNLADLQIASALSGVHSYNSTGLVGLCGLISGIIASWQSWQTC